MKELYENPTKYRKAMDKLWCKEDLDYWDADPATLPPKKEKKEEKDYSHFFITQDEKGNINNIIFPLNHRLMIYFCTF